MKKSTLKEFISSFKKNTTEIVQSKTMHRTARGLSAKAIRNIAGIVSVFIIGCIALYFMYIHAGPILHYLFYVFCAVVVLAVLVYLYTSPKESFGVIVFLLLSIVAVAYYNGTL